MKCDIIEMYTDGACSSNPGPAGIGIVIKYNGQRKEISDYIGRSTNNKAELEAISRGLGHIMFGCSIQFLTNNVIIYTDSIYSINVISNKWKSKKNKELIEIIQEMITDHFNATFIKIKAHNGNIENEKADQLAREAIDRNRRNNGKQG